MKTTKKKVDSKGVGKNVLKTFESSVKNIEQSKRIKIKDNNINGDCKDIDYSIVIKQRKLKLEEVKEKLKKDFDGLDGAIDRFISSITCWYCIPEIMERPLILCIWGMTGSGKTDLLRKFIKYLDFEGKSCEITVDTNRELSIKDRLEYSPLKENEPGILILDEIQRGRTIDEDGNEDTESKINDLWSLLSDGKFASHADRKEELLESLLQEKYETISFPLDEEDRANPYKRSFYEAKILKRKLSSSVDVELIMKMEEKEYNNFIRKEIEKPEFSRSPSYKKLLICVVGNLDGAYEMSKDINTDRDADVLHDWSKNININTIKNSLLKLFKPEQIARFGNNHIIYPSFSKETYNKLISRYLNSSIENIKNISKFDITYDSSLNEMIYKNGVYPTQGVRPVHSTIQLLISEIPKFLVYAYENNYKKISLKIEGSDFIAIYDDNLNIITKESTEDGNNVNIIKTSIKRDIEEIKKKHNKNVTVQVSVHEAAHAVIYGKVFGVAPLQIIVDSVDTSCEGYIQPHWGSGSKSFNENSIKVLLAGYLAEEHFFGKHYRTGGCSGDLQMATGIAADMVRNYGMYEKLSYQDVPGNENGNVVYSNLKVSDELMESILKKEEEKTRILIQENFFFIKELAQYLIDNSTIKIKDFVVMAKKYGIDCVEKLSDEPIVENYEKMFREKTQ